MIARVWRGWTKAEDADAYERLLREVVYPRLQKIDGYHGGYIFRQENEHETEFLTQLIATIHLATSAANQLTIDVSVGR